MEYIKLSNGLNVPANGFGVYQVSQKDCKESVLAALRVGYRHIDTAQAYANEKEVGEAIRESGIDRKDIFVTTKVWITNYGEEKAYQSVINSLKVMGLEYADLILLHQPFSDYYGAYRAIERLYEEGKVKSIGVSNFSADRLVDLCGFCKIKPMVNQVEINVFHQQNELKKWADKYGIVLEAWAPFGEGRNNMFTNETLVKIGQRHNKSVAQVILRWLFERGIISLAKSVHENRIKENFDIYSFSLTKEDHEEIASLNADTSLFFDHTSPEVAELFVSWCK